MTEFSPAPVDPGRFRAHAANLSTLSALLGEIRGAGPRLEQSPAAFGPVCGWMLTGLDERVTRHREQMAYIEETLRLTVDGLHRVADGEQELKDMVRRDGDVATPDGTPVIDDPPYSLSGLMDSVIAEVRSWAWVEPQLASAEFAAPARRSSAALRVAGLHYALTSVDPVRELLDGLTGTPDLIAAQAGRWDRIGTDLRQVGALLRECLERDLPRRDRLDVRSYQALMANNVEGLIGCAEIATAMAVVVEAAGDLARLARDVIRGVIADLFAQVIVWTFDPSGAVSRPVLLTRLGSVVATSWRVHAYLAALTTSITTLSEIVDG